MTPTPATGHAQTSTRPTTHLRVRQAVLRVLLLGPLCLAIVLTTGCSAFQPDEERVRDAIQAHFDSWATASSTRSADAFEKNSCAALAAKIRQAFEDEGVGEGPDDGTRFTMTVDSITNIQVTDDSATASVIVHSSSKPDPKSFSATVIKEDGAWKYCTL